MQKKSHFHTLARLLTGVTLTFTAYGMNPEIEQSSNIRFLQAQCQNQWFPKEINGLQAKGELFLDNPMRQYFYIQSKEAEEQNFYRLGLKNQKISRSEYQDIHANDLIEGQLGNIDSHTIDAQLKQNDDYLNEVVVQPSPPPKPSITKVTLDPASLKAYAKLVKKKESEVVDQNGNILPPSSFKGLGGRSLGSVNKIYAGRKTVSSAVTTPVVVQTPARLDLGDKRHVLQDQINVLKSVYQEKGVEGLAQYCQHAVEDIRNFPWGDSLDQGAVFNNFRFILEKKRSLDIAVGLLRKGDASLGLMSIDSLMGKYDQYNQAYGNLMTENLFRSLRMVMNLDLQELNLVLPSLPENSKFDAVNGTVFSKDAFENVSRAHLVQTLVQKSLGDKDYVASQLFGLRFSEVQVQEDALPFAIDRLETVYNGLTEFFSKGHNKGYLAQLVNSDDVLSIWERSYQTYYSIVFGQGLLDQEKFASMGEQVRKDKMVINACLQSIKCLDFPSQREALEDILNISHLQKEDNHYENRLKLLQEKSQDSAVQATAKADVLNTIIGDLTELSRDVLYIDNPNWLNQVEDVRTQLTQVEDYLKAQSIPGSIEAGNRTGEFASQKILEEFDAFWASDIEEASIDQRAEKLSTYLAENTVRIKDAVKEDYQKLEKVGDYLNFSPYDYEKSLQSRSKHLDKLQEVLQGNMQEEYESSYKALGHIVNADDKKSDEENRKRITERRERNQKRLDMYVLAVQFYQFLENYGVQYKNIDAYQVEDKVLKALDNVFVQVKNLDTNSVKEAIQGVKAALTQGTFQPRDKDGNVLATLSYNPTDALSGQLEKLKGVVAVKLPTALVAVKKDMNAFLKMLQTYRHGPQVSYTQDGQSVMLEQFDEQEFKDFAKSMQRELLTLTEKKGRLSFASDLEEAQENVNKFLSDKVKKERDSYAKVKDIHKAFGHAADVLQEVSFAPVPRGNISQSEEYAAFKDFVQNLHSDKQDANTENVTVENPVLEENKDNHDMTVIQVIQEN